VLASCNLLTVIFRIREAGMVRWGSKARFRYHADRMACGKCNFVLLTILLFKLFRVKSMSCWRTLDQTSGFKQETDRSRWNCYKYTEWITTTFTIPCSRLTHYYNAAFV